MEGQIKQDDVAKAVVEDDESLQCYYKEPHNKNAY